jgi:hypothetical protein
MTDHPQSAIVEESSWSTASHGEFDHVNEADHDDVYRFRPDALIGTDLRLRFKDALMKLEGLLYAVFGAIPDYENQIPWYDRENPRCQWPQQLVEQPRDTFGSPGYVESWQITAARGQTHGGTTSPSVPVRSRSGDPAVQFARSPHSTYFPRGSVQRYCGSPGSTGHQVHDPASAYKAFPSWPDAENVTVRWTQPAGVQSVESLTLHYRIEGGGSQQVAMAETEPGSGIWEATITPPADQQDRWVDWYITGRFDGAAIDRHDPDTGATAPVLGGRVSDPEHDRDPNHAYTFVFFSHHNPYAGGLPELWPLCKRGTDEYRFDASEQIQPQLINLARWCLDYIGRHTQHHPRRRGSAWEHCCIHMPVHFRWSGANHPGHYLSGGKGGSDNVRPLTNSPEESFSGASESARMTWRGQDMLWKGTDWPDLYGNCQFGGDESWISPPEVVHQDLCPDLPWPANWDYCRGCGLQPGDIIDPVHLEEIVAAVEFFLDQGVWLTMPTYSMRWSPAGVGGLDCGRELAEIIGGSPLFGCYERDRINASWLCCSESNPCPGGSWDDCQGRHERCILAQGQSEWAYYIDHYAYGVFQEHCRFKSLNCNATGASPVGGGSHAFETEINSGPDHDPSIPQQDLSVSNSRGASAIGWSAYLCGPRPYLGAPGEGEYASGNPMWSAIDTAHGNGFSKARRQWIGGQFTLVDWTLSFGNSFEGTTPIMCGSHPEDPEPHPSLDFYEVKTVYWRGLATGWLGETSVTPSAVQACMDSFCADSFSAWVAGGTSGYPLSIPGMGIYQLPGWHDGDWPGSDWPADEDLLCHWDWNDCISHGNLGCWTWGDCDVFDPYPYCLGDTAYVEINLNIDGEGRPTLRPFNMSIHGLNDNGTPNGEYPRDHCLSVS